MKKTCDFSETNFTFKTFFKRSDINVKKIQFVFSILSIIEILHIYIYHKKGTMQL